VTVSEQNRPDSHHSVLLVVEHAEDRIAIRTALEGLGHPLVDARSGEEALVRLEETEFAVVLLDVQISGLGGAEVARRIRSHPRSRHTPVIFFAAHEDPQFPPTRAYSLGAVDYLVKPVAPEVLRAKVASLVELRALAGEARRQADQFRLLVDGTREYAIFLIDSDGRIRTWNSGAERIKGYTAAEIIGRHFSCFYTPEDAAAGKPQQVLKRARETGSYEEEGWRVRKDGSRFWASIVLTALRDQSGALRGFSKVTRDQTERVQAETNARRLLEEEAMRRAAEASAREARQAHEEERRQREQWRVTLSSIGDAVIVTDTQGTITFLNSVAQALTGWDQSAMEQPLDHVFRIINEETRLPVESPMTKVLREGYTVGLANHTVLIARDGREHLIDDAAAPIRSEDGAISGVVLVFRDVTEVRRAMEARLHLAAIVESSDDAIISKDLEGTITSWNRGAEGLFGYTAEEIVGRPLGILVPPDHPNELPALLERLRRGERIDHLETVRVRKDGRRINVSLTISPIRNATGRIVGASKIARDITAVKEAERRKDEFLAILGHELRNPLAAVVNGMELLRRKAHGEAEEQLCALVDRQARHMKQLVDDLLDVSRITRGLIPLRRERLDLVDVLRRVAEDHRRAFAERECRFHVELPAKPLWIEGDTTRLAQIFGNLLHNAWKFTAPGDRVTLAAETAAEGAFASVSVRDTGIGMSAETIAGLFQPFSQPVQPLDGEHGGLGLGLALVQGLCALHGGSVEAHSEGLGQGSAFTVRLPLATGAAAVAAADPRTGAGSAGHPFRVLVVEDSQPVADVFAMMIRELGHDVDVVASGPEALARMAAEPPDIVVSDISMPGMSGYDLAQHIRTSQNGRGIFLVALTGFGQPEDRQRALAAGFDEHLVKPVELTRLQDVFAAVPRP
jgi:PAS domain S-box-containing protein